MAILFKRVATALAFTLATSSACAERLPVKLFAQHPQYSSVAMSPDGQHLAITTPVDNRTDLLIVDLSGKDEPVRVRYRANEHVFAPLWADDDRLVVGKGKKFGFLEAPFSLGEIYSTNLSGEKQEMLFGYQPDDDNRRGVRKDLGFAYVEQRIQPLRGEMLVTFQSWEQKDKKTYIYRVNATTGKRNLIERLNLEAASIATDQSNRPRFAKSADDHLNPILRYRPTADSEWLPVPATLAGRDMSVLTFAKDNNIAYAEISDKGEPEVLYKVDFSKGTREKVLDRGEYDTGGITYAGFDPQPFAIVSYLPKLSIQYLDTDSEWTKLHAGLMKRFAGNYVAFEEFSRDDKRVLISVSGDRNPGQYYLLDRNKNTFAKILDSFEGIDPTKLAAMRPIEFKNRDGVSLSGMLTLPTSGAAPYPMVMLPHGGPHGVSDYWSFDSDVQFLANRGYAVLQVNFQGSANRGENFERSTYRKWGTTIMDDIADGVRWAIGQQVADKDRICIYGASFGGYSALMNPVRYPGMYQCAIGYAGIYDLEMDYSKGDVNDTRRGRNSLVAMFGTDEAEMARHSPARQADKVLIPTLLVHGKDDQRCPFAQFKMMRDGLEKAGTPLEVLVKDAEAHGFYKEENRIELYQKMEAFLDKHIGAKAATK